LAKRLIPSALDIGCLPRRSFTAGGKSPRADSFAKKGFREVLRKIGFQEMLGFHPGGTYDIES